MRTEQTSNRRDFLVKASGVGLAAIGSGMLYKSWTLQPDFSDRQIRSQDVQEAPSSLETPPIHHHGDLAIVQEHRLGTVYLDRISGIYDKFAPFDPYSSVVVGERETVETGSIYVRPDTVTGIDSHRRLPSLFGKSLIGNLLEHGQNYRALEAYAGFVRLIQNDFSRDSIYDEESIETALTLLNPMPERGNGHRDDPIEAFGTVTGALYNSSDAIKERVLALPTDMIHDSSGYPVPVDSNQKYLCKELLEATLDVYDELLPAEMGNLSKNRCLDALFYKVGLMRYELFRERG